MPNVYMLDGSTNIKMGTFCGQPAIFIRPVFPKDRVNHSHEERHAWHTNDLAENEQVIVLDKTQDLGQLYMALRQPTEHVAMLNGGGDLSVHLHTHPESGEQAIDRRFGEKIVERNFYSEPSIKIPDREIENVHTGVSLPKEIKTPKWIKTGTMDGGGTIVHTKPSVEIIDGLLHISGDPADTEANPKLGRGMSNPTLIIDPPPEIAAKIYEAYTGEPAPEITTTNEGQNNDQSN